MTLLCRVSRPALLASVPSHLRDAEELGNLLPLEFLPLEGSPQAGQDLLPPTIQRFLGEAEEARRLGDRPASYDAHLDYQTVVRRQFPKRLLQPGDQSLVQLAKLGLEDAPLRPLAGRRL